MTSSVGELARRLFDVEQQLRAGTSTPQLSHSSIEDGAVEEYALDGTLSGRYGKQFDDTHVAASLNGPTPPTPSGLLTLTGYFGVTAVWTGGLSGAVVPMDFARVDVHMAPQAAGASFVPDETTLKGSILSPRGGVLFVSRVPGDYYVRLVVVSAPGKMSAPSAGVLGTASAAPLSDGSAPPAVGSAPTVDGYPGGMILRWAPVTNSTAVRYVVEVSTASTGQPWVAYPETNSAIINLTKLPNGDLFAPLTTYYFRVLARDVDADASYSPVGAGMMRQADNQLIAASYVYAGGITAGQILTGTLTADLTMSGTMIAGVAGGARVEMGPFGQIIYGPAGTPTSVFPTDGSPAKFAGEVEASGLTVTGDFTFRGIGNEFAKASVTYLRSATSATPSPPTAVVDWPDPKVFPLFAGNVGLCWTGTEFITAGDTAAGDGSGLPQPQIRTESTYVTLPVNAPRPFGGVVKLGTSYYVLGWLATAGTTEWWISRYNSSGALVSSVQYTPINGTWGGGGNAASGLAPAALGHDGTNLLVAEFNTTNNTFRVQVRDATSLAVSSTITTTANSGFSGPAVAVRRGNFDFGADRLIILSKSGNHLWAFTVSGTTATYAPNDTFAAPQPGQMSGFDWIPTGQGGVGDGGRFWSTRARWVAANPWIYKHTKHTWSGADPKTIYFRSRWERPADGYVSLLGPAGSTSLKKRAALRLTSTAVPNNGAGDDPTHVTFWVGDVNSSAANLHKTTAPGAGSNTILLKDDLSLTSGATPVDSGNFPQTTPAKIQSDALAVDGLPHTIIRGDGTGRLREISVGQHIVASGDSSTASTGGTFVSAAGLVFPMIANGIYVTDLELIFTSAVSAANTAIRFSVPAGASYNVSGIGPGQLATSSVAGNVATSAVIGTGGGTPIVFGSPGTFGPSGYLIRLRAKFVMSTTSGNGQLEFARSVSGASAGAITLKAASFADVVRKA